MALMHRGLFRENLISIFNQFQFEYTTFPIGAFLVIDHVDTLI